LVTYSGSKSCNKNHIVAFRNNDRSVEARRKGLIGIKRYQMKAAALLLVSVLATNCAFGQEHKFQIGGSLGGNISLSHDRFNMTGINRQLQVGGSAAAIALYSMSPRVNLTGRMGGLVERFGTTRNTESTYLDYDWEYSWAEVTGIVSYLTVVKEKFDLFTGIGFTARRLLEAKLSGELVSSNGNRADFSDHSVYGQTNTWNYLLPIQAGLNFHRASGSSIQTSLEAQIGLRNRSYYPGSANDVLPNEKLLGVSLKVAYLFQI
jgi:hypothetical protein